MGTLSLLIPAYNAEHYLPRLLLSAQKQARPFDEILVYDDCSTDRTAEVARAFGAKVVRGARNVGCSTGKNILARLAQSEWVHFHDADDEMLPNFTSLAHAWMERDAVDIVLFDYEWRDDQTNELLGHNRFERLQLENDPRRYSIIRQINPFCGLYRLRPLLDAGGYDEDPLVLYNEDSAFHIRMAFAGLRFSAEAEISIINYRVARSMSGSNELRCMLSQHHVLRRTWESPCSKPYAAEIAARLWNLSGSLAAIEAWSEAREAALLARSIHLPTNRSGKLWFRALAAVNPIAAVHVRERAIRWFKPALRRK